VYNVREVSISKLDVQEWNELLTKSEVCDAFQTFEWARVLRNSTKAHPSFLMVQRNKETIGGVMFLKRKIFKIFDCYEIRGGPSYVKGENKTVMKNIMKTLQKKRRKSTYLLFVPFPLVNYGFKEMFAQQGYHPFPFRTIIIDSAKPLEEIWCALDKKARWGVKKANKLGVEVRNAESFQEWKEFYHLHMRHSSERQYPPESYSFFKEMFKLHSKNMSRLFVAKYGNRTIAGSLFLIYKRNMVFLHNASLPTFLSHNPNNLLQWKSIEWANKNGVTIYDMNGLPIEETKYLRGVYRYKKRWDGRICWYYYYINRKLLYSGIHLARTNSFAFKLVSCLRKHEVI